MHVTAPQSALLTNHEVLLHLQAEEAEYSGTDGTNRGRPKPSNYNAIVRDTLSYLTHESQPLSQLLETRSSRPATMYLGPDSLFARLLAELQPNAASTAASKPGKRRKTRLNKAEFLQIYNLRPKTMVDLECIIEEAGDRFTDQELEAILEGVKRVFDTDEKNVPVGSENVPVPERKGTGGKKTRAG